MIVDRAGQFHQDVNDKEDLDHIIRICSKYDNEEKKMYGELIKLNIDGQKDIVDFVKKLVKGLVVILNCIKKIKRII